MTESGRLCEVAGAQVYASRKATSHKIHGDVDSDRRLAE